MPDNDLRHRPTPDGSALIVNYNSGPLLARCISALRDAERQRTTEIIDVDNGSTDGSLENLPPDCAPDLLIPAGRNLGFGPANNLGAATAEGKYLLLVNTDCFVERGLIDQ